MLAVFAAEAAVLVTAKRRHVAHRAISIDPYGARAHARADIDGATDAAGPDTGGEPVIRLIGDRDRLVLIVETNDAEHRAEDLLLRDPHTVVHAGEDRR